MQGFFFNNFENSFLPEILKEIYRDKVYDRFFDGKKDLTVVDVGCNIGLFTYYAYPFAKKIYAIEPSTEHVEVLNKMLSFNGMKDKVEVVQKAIFHKDESMVFYHNKNTTMYSLNKSVADNSLSTEVVDAVRMDTFFTRHGIDTVDFLKLDIEGAEMEVVGGEGFQNVVNKIKAMTVEYHSWTARNPSQLVMTLGDYGFEVFPIKTDAALFGAIRK